MGVSPDALAVGQRPCRPLSVGAWSAASAAPKRAMFRESGRAAQKAQQAGGRAIQPRSVATGQPRLNVLGQHLAQLHTPLVKAVDATQAATYEHAVLLQRNQRAQRGGGERIQQQEGAGPVAREVAVPIF